MERRANNLKLQRDIGMAIPRILESNKGTTQSALIHLVVVLKKGGQCVRTVLLATLERNVKHNTCVSNAKLLFVWNAHTNYVIIVVKNCKFKSCNFV